MKLRTQFSLLVLVSAVVPIVATGFLGLIAARAELLTGPGRELIAAREHLQRAVESGAGLQELSEIVQRASRVKLLLEDEGYRVLASNLSAAEKPAAGSLVELSRFPGGFFMARIGSSDRSYYLAAVQLRPEAIRAGFLSTFGPLAGVFVLFLLFLPFVVSLFMNRTIKAIRALQEATRHVASGDLDFRPPASGPEEIAELARSFDAMRVSLREEMERRARLLMSISHDLKTPLTAVRGYIEALRDGHGATEGQRERYLTIIEQKSMLLESRIREIVNFVSLSTGDWQVTRRPIDLGSFITGIAKELEEEAAVFGRRFTWRVQLEAGVVAMLDEQLFRRSLENLVSNAIKFTAPGGAIDLNCHSLEDATELVISDDGPGISDAERARVFDPFYRGAGMAGTPGMGLGLSIVKSILEAHGFSITVGGNTGASQGAVLRIRMPSLNRRAAPL